MRRMNQLAIGADMTQGALRQCAICAWGVIGGARAHTWSTFARGRLLSASISVATGWARRKRGIARAVSDVTTGTVGAGCTAIDTRFGAPTSRWS